MKKLFTFFAAMLVALAVNAAVINVSPGTNTIASAISSASAGDVLVLAAGTYTDNNYIDFTKSVEIQAAEDAETMPVIQVGTYVKVENGTNVKITGVKIDGSQQGSRDQVFRVYAGAKSLEIVDCEITAGKKPMFRVESGQSLEKLIMTNCKAYDNTGKLISNEGTIGRIELHDCEISGNGDIVIKGASTSHADSCIVNNCYFHNNTQQSIYFEASGTEGTETVDKLIVTNSTFANTTALTNWISIVEARPYSTATSTTSDAIKVIIDHCTFYNNPCVDSGHANIRTHYLSDVTVSNCIFMHPTELAQRAVYCDTGGTVSNCLTFNFTKDTERASISYGCTPVNCFAADPLFVNVEEGFQLEGNWVTMELSPARGAATDGSDLGDPRWYTAETLPEVDFEDPYILEPTKAQLSGLIELSEGSLKWKNNSTTTDGVAKWKLDATSACYVSATVTESTSSGHCYKVVLLDEQGQLVGDTIGEAANTWKSGELTLGTFLIPVGIHTIKLLNLTANSSSAVSAPTLTTVDNLRALYLKPNADWKSDGARFALYATSSDVDGKQWYDMTEVDGADGFFEVAIPASKETVIFCRMNGATTENIWDNKWNQTADLTIEDGKDLYTITGWSTGAWCKYGATALVGPFNEWNTIADIFEPDLSGETASITKTLEANTDYEFKVLINGDYRSNGHAYHKGYTGASDITGDGDNMKLTTDIAGSYTITWSFATNAISITFPTATAIDETNASLKAQKFIENGQLILIKNGVRYNAQGLLVK
ncbi:MAG: DUF4957 domain-containing protein [Paludibacteraceae bacterium]|nr:DUF4957 domain-containing protein [Paludibacteraceae bacterium]